MVAMLLPIPLALAGLGVWALVIPNLVADLVKSASFRLLAFEVLANLDRSTEEYQNTMDELKKMLKRRLKTPWHLLG